MSRLCGSKLPEDPVSTRQRGEEQQHSQEKFLPEAIIQKRDRPLKDTFEVSNVKIWKFLTATVNVTFIQKRISYVLRVFASKRMKNNNDLCLKI